MKKLLCMCILAAAALILAAGCDPPDVKQANAAAKLREDDKHKQAVEIFNKLARQSDLHEYAAQKVQLDFCRYYGETKKRKDIKTLAKKDYKTIADSCMIFYEKNPKRTDEGLGPFQLGVIYKDLQEWDAAIKAFKLAEKKRFYREERSKTNRREQQNCESLYKNLVECYMHIPGEAGEKGMEDAGKKAFEKCDAKLILQK